MYVLIKCCVSFDKIYVKCCMCVICSKINFITNIINSIRIHTFYFYNNKHTYINTDTTFITKHINFIKINTNLVVGPKSLYSMFAVWQASEMKRISKYQISVCSFWILLDTFKNEGGNHVGFGQMIFLSNLKKSVKLNYLKNE